MNLISLLIVILILAVVGVVALNRVGDDCNRAGTTTTTLVPGLSASVPGLPGQCP